MIMTCENCLHYDRCKKLGICNIEILSICEDFTNRSEWVHLPDNEYTFTIRDDIAKGLIIANCRASDKEKKERENNA